MNKQPAMKCVYKENVNKPPRVTKVSNRFSVTLRSLLSFGKEPLYLLSKSLNGPYDLPGSDDEVNNLMESNPYLPARVQVALPIELFQNKWTLKVWLRFNWLDDLARD
jgi:hypothetical protein